MTPILELRGAIPIALNIYGLPAWSALLFSWLGNITVVFFLLVLIKPASRWLIRHFKFFRLFLSKLFNSTEKRHQKKFIRWKKFALFFLAALPLPFTGGWTGSLCAFLFEIPFKDSFFLLSLGLAVAGFIVLSASLGFFSFF